MFMLSDKYLQTQFVSNRSVCLCVCQQKQSFGKIYVDNWILGHFIIYVLSNLSLRLHSNTVTQPDATGILP